MNRGLARRTMFESAGDIAVFLGELGEATDRGEIEVHAYCMMTTHYHLLARSPIGQIGRAMQRVQTAYSHWFNRGRDRDGTLVKGRYAARRIDSLRYRRAVVAYIDRNPVAAKMVCRAEDYPHGSARIYAGMAHSGPAWLKRDWVEAEMREVRRRESSEREIYFDIFGRLPAPLDAVVEARTRSRAPHDPLDDLVRAAPARVSAWMRRRALLADGFRPGLPVLDWSLAVESVGELARRQRSWQIADQDAWQMMRIGIARMLTATTIAQIACHEQTSRTRVRRLEALHRSSMLGDRLYATRTGQAVHAALDLWRGLTAQR